MWEGGRGLNLKLIHTLKQMTLVYKTEDNKNLAVMMDQKVWGVPLVGQTFNDRILQL